MKNAQLSMSIARTNTFSAHATSTNHGAESPITDRATPTTKNAAIPNSARASAVALETDMKDSNAVVDKTTRTCRRVVPGRPTDFITSTLYSSLMRAQRSNLRQARNANIRLD